MGLFDVFKKKACCICGNEVGLIGNRKLSDGNMCSKCAKKLSPWFEDRRNSTVEEIKEQLAYRQSNARELENFHPTRTFGDRDYLYVEDRGGVPYRFCVSRGKDYLEENADLVLFENLEDVIFEIDGNPNEVFKQQGEEEVPYDPPKYDYSFEFHVTLIIRNVPWFDRIEFHLNGSNPELFSVEDLGDLAAVEAFAEKSRVMHSAFSREFLRYKKMCDAIAALKDSAAAAPAQSSGPKHCPSCGAISGGGRFCEYCGSPL